MSDLKARIKNTIEKRPECVAPDNRLRASSSGGCIRRLDYDGLYGAPPLKDEDWLRFEIGHVSHEMWTKILKDTFGSDFVSVDEEVDIETPKGRSILGHPDGRLESLKTTVEIKSTSKAIFEMCKYSGKPLPEHVAQVNLYAHGFGDKHWVIIYYNRNNSEYMFFNGDYDIGLAIFTLETFDLAYENREAKRISPRPYADKTEAPCFFCPHRDRCYEGFKAEVEGADQSVLDDERVLSMAREYWNERSTRLDTEKSESRAMDNLKSELFVKRKLNEVVVNGSGDERYLVTFRSGANSNLIGKVVKKGGSDE